MLVMSNITHKQNSRLIRNIALGLAILWRPWAARACLAQAAIAAFYLIAATLTVPELWLDPLGPLVKIAPALMLSLIARPMLESR